jgi:predicted outer membrane repeat protein
MVEDPQQLNDAIADFIVDPECNLIEFGGSFEIESDDPSFEPISTIAIDPVETPTAMTKDLTIDGQGFTLTGDSGVSGFVIYLGSPDGSNTLTIRNLGMSGFGGSGAVSVVSGATVIDRSLFANNKFHTASSIPGMDGASAGAINAVGRLVVTESQFAGNTGFEGGAIHSAPTLVPQLVPAGAALPPVQISGSTFADNAASTAGGAIYALQSLVMSNSTVTDNSGGSAGAVNVDGTISLDFCTIVDNMGGGLGAAV